MNYDGDAFISYAHLDNVELIEGHKGWVANLHRALEVRVGQLLGKAPHIWRDPKLQGNDVFATTLVDRLQRVAALVAVVSPRYVRSEWTRRELNEFWSAAEQQGGIKVRDKARVFKVLKTPVSNDLLPPELRTMLGYEFFRVDPETGRVRELDEVFGPEAQRDFWLRLDDLAHDICTLLEMLEVPGEAAAEEQAKKTEAVYLAETTSDLREQRESLRRDLLQHGYEVLPSTVLPTVAADLELALADDLERCIMSIHLVGKNYSLVPEGGTQSLVEIQNEMAIRRSSASGRFARLLWIPAGLEVSDPRQQKVLDQIRVDPRMQDGADVLETSLEELRTVYVERLESLHTQPPSTPSAAPSAAPANAAPAAVKSIYLIYDQRDADACHPWVDFMFEQGCEVIRPVFDGDEAELREYHEENLCNCDGAILLCGSVTEMWIRRKLRELQKAAGYGRTKPPAPAAIVLLPPRTPDKERFRTHEAVVIPQLEGLSPDPLHAFVARLKGEEGRQSDAASAV